mgnify:CR=1 FL=1
MLPFLCIVPQEDVLPELSMNELLNVGETSIADSIIVVSLNSVTGKDSARVKQLFLATAVFAEDQRIPSRVFQILHASSTELSKDNKDNDAKAASTSTIKRWIALLVKRSLLLELIRGSIQLHDSKRCKLFYLPVILI